jgi:alginate O-acetyltransferase complex protein AlgI
MLFNSFDFAIFLPIVFVLFWFVFAKNLKLQNAFLVLSSYVFYAWWDVRFLALIFFSTILDYVLGIKLEKEDSPKKRKILLSISLMANLGILFYFKYANFFIENFSLAFTFLGQNINPERLEIILPVGISFYTFQTLSYTIDVYRKKINATNQLLDFMAYVSFFPQLVAGPIERAAQFLPQFQKARILNYPKAVSGLKQILWGLFKKVVIADNCAVYADIVFNNTENYNGFPLVLGAVFFAFQIYGDFSGYTDIALGTARLFGFELMKNFNFPYFSRDIAEFWRRWHISLSSWFKDYVYIPLGGNQNYAVRNIFIVFLVSAFWHGANFTYIIWGLLHALYFVPLYVFKVHRNNLTVVAENKKMPSFSDLIKMTSTFLLVVFAWIFFRAESVTHAILYIKNIVKDNFLNFESFPSHAAITAVLVIFMLFMEWISRNHDFGTEKLFSHSPKIIRWGFYVLLVFIIGMFMQTNQSPFIYFQF